MDFEGPEVQNVDYFYSKMEKYFGKQSRTKVV